MDVDGSLFYLSISHLRGDGALPDQLVKALLLAGSIDAGLAHVGRADGLVSLLRSLRAGMIGARLAVQIGILKRFFTVVYEKDEGEFDVYVVVNPKITSTSTEKIYVEDGEGCLSINRPTEGIVPRFARITVEGYDTKGNKIKLRLREDLAIAFQHEIDHLNGILFIDHIDKNNPFKDANKYRAI